MVRGRVRDRVKVNPCTNPTPIPNQVMHKNGSSNTVWLIEKHTPGKIFDGDTCLWEGQYRIRHLATGRLLAVIMEPGEVEDFNEDVRVRGNDRAAASGASPRAARSGAL
eukprot:scaffold128777_cov27-Phaeocystis_antarctica.AAC.1